MTDAYGHYDTAAAAREIAEQVARREMERDMAWAQHVADALLILEDD